METTYHVELDSEDSLALTVDDEGNAKISARDPAVAPPDSVVASTPDFFSDNITWETSAKSEVTTDTEDGVNGIRSYGQMGNTNNVAKGELTTAITNDETKLMVFDWDYKRSSNEVDGRWQDMILSSEDVSDGYGDPVTNLSLIHI